QASPSSTQRCCLSRRSTGDERMTDREIYERLREPLMRFASSLVGWQSGACAQWLTFDSATREWDEVHVPGWEALLAPDGSAIYALTREGRAASCTATAWAADRKAVPRHALRLLSRTHVRARDRPWSVGDRIRPGGKRSSAPGDPGRCHPHRPRPRDPEEAARIA